MKTYKLIAISAATLLTFASLSAINYNIPVQATGVTTTRLAHVTNLAPIHVYPSPAEQRGLSKQSSTADSNATLASAAPAEGGHAGSAFQLVGSALSMSHYSRVPSIGRISKE